MRIAVVHSYYSSRQPSGENIAVDSQVALLREAGHDVVLVTQRTDDRERGHSYPLQAAWTVATGRGRSPLAALRDFRPDVVHVHNLFPNWGTRWLTKWRGPVVATLHNFRPLCAEGNLFREGESCTVCPDGNPWAGVRFGCYRDSPIATLPLAWRNRGGAMRDAVISRADRLIVPSGRACDLYLRYGVPRERMKILPNFVMSPAPSGSRSDHKRTTWLSVGRLTPEKGVGELVDHWPEDARLDVVGDGPLLPQLQANAPERVEFLGALARSRVREMMSSYAGLVFPSRCVESAAPLVVIEALAAGLPVVALAGNSASDLLAHTGAGVVVPDDTSWGRGLAAVRTQQSQLSIAAREAYERHFHPDSWLGGITRVYKDAISAYGISP